MKKTFLIATLLLCVLDLQALTLRSRGLDNARTPLIASEKVIATSPDPSGVFLFTPALVEGFDGRFVAAIDYGGPGTEILDGPLSSFGDYKSGNQIRVLLSDDRGKHWKDSGARIPMMHEILFKAGNRLYMLGHSKKLMICCSDDNGQTWTMAGIVAVGPTDHSSRNYATLMISGRDIFIVSRSGDENARNNHDGNIVTFHRVKNFRKLIY